MLKEQLYALAVGFLKPGTYDKALDYFTQAQAAGHPVDAAFNYNLGLALVKLNRFDEAIAAFSLSSKERPEAFNSLVITYHVKFDHAPDLDAKKAVLDEMLANIDKYKEFAAQHLLNIRSILLQAYIAAGSVPAAIIAAMEQYCDIGITLQSPDTGYFYANMGKICCDYARSLDLSHSNRSPLLATAEGLLSKAHEFYETNNIAILNNLAIVKEASEKWQDAVHLIAEKALAVGDHLKSTLISILIKHDQPALAARVLQTTAGTDHSELVRDLESVSLSHSLVSCSMR